MDLSTACPVQLFDNFASASEFDEIQQCFNQLCTAVGIDPLDHERFYERIKAKLPSWKAEKLWALLDQRANHKEYKQQRACQSLRVLIIGAGPCGLRASIECALLGAKTVVVERRDTFSRNNVLHLWPFVIADLKNLGAKLFYPKFCAGSLDHISIRQLQCILLKVALVLGVQVVGGVGFEELIMPARNPNNGEMVGWRAELSPSDHYLSDYEFDVAIAADGKRNSLPGFPRRELRGKLAIGITANFVNRRTHAEERCPEISGVAFIFNQQFFKDMRDQTGIDLENVVYYKDDTHYFVMCAKKQSLIDKGVLLQDCDDITGLLDDQNVDHSALLAFARQAADFATNGALPRLDYALNHQGQPDVAMFDFTSLFSAEISCRILDRNGCRLLMGVVGDSLHEPFWPTGSGCARGFLGVMDTCWLMHGYASRAHGVLQLLAERETVYRLLAQSTPETLQKNVNKYTIDPRSRYPSLDVALRPEQMLPLIDTDNTDGVHEWIDPVVNSARAVKASPCPTPRTLTTHQRFFYQQQRVLNFMQNLLRPYKLSTYNFGSCWTNGLALCALVDRFRPDLLTFGALDASEGAANRHLAFELIEKEFGLTPPTDDVDWLNGACTSHDGEFVTFEYLLVLQRILTEHINNRIATLTARGATSAQRNTTSTQASGTQKAPHPMTMTGLAPEFMEKLQQRKKQNQSISDEQMDELLDTVAGDLDEQQVADILNEWDDYGDARPETSSPTRTQQKLKQRNRRSNGEDKILTPSQLMAGVRTPSFHKDDDPNVHPGATLSPGRRAANNNPAAKWRAQKPGFVEKLDPSRLVIVESIVTGKLAKEERAQMYKRKRKEANVRTRKLDDEEIKDMENKLETTAMGSLLFDKARREKFQTMSGLEQKIIAAKTRDMMEIANEGFKPRVKPDMQALDERLQNLEKMLRNPERMTLTPVSKLIGKHQQETEGVKPSNTTSATTTSPSKQSNAAPPPPPPPKQHRLPLVTSNQPPMIGRQPSPCVPSMRPSQPQCTICGHSVYLAERILVEQCTLHRRCFKCAYCSQPLRIGNCVFDRQLREHPRGKQYGIRIYCQSHSQMPISEKLRRLERDQVKSARAESVQPLMMSNGLVDKQMHSRRLSWTGSPAVNGVATDTAGTSRSQSHHDQLADTDPAADQHRTSPGHNRDDSPERDRQQSIEQNGDATDDEFSDGELEQLESIMEQSGHETFNTREATELADTLKRQKKCKTSENLEVDEKVEEGRQDKDKRHVHLFKDADSIRERTQREMARRRAEAECRAQAKSDAELGIAPRTPTKQSPRTGTGSGGLLASLFGAASVNKQRSDKVDIGAVEKKPSLMNANKDEGETSEQKQQTHHDVNVASKPSPRTLLKTVSGQIRDAADQLASNVSRAEVERVQRAAERVRRHRDEQRAALALQLKRRQDEVETRLLEVRLHGNKMERILSAEDGGTQQNGNDEDNVLLTEWRHAVDEYHRLRAEQKENELRLRAIQLEHEHSTLQTRLTVINEQHDTNTDELDTDSLKLEQELLQKMLVIVAERDKVMKQLDCAKQTERIRQEQDINQLYTHVTDVFQQSLADLSST